MELALANFELTHQVRFLDEKQYTAACNGETGEGRAFLARDWECGVTFGEIRLNDRYLLPTITGRGGSKSSRHRTCSVFP